MDNKLEITPKIEELKEPIKAEAPQAEPELTDKAEDTSEAISESTSTKATKKNKTNHGVNIVTFIGNGMWTDEKGEMWHKNHPNVESERQYSDEEYEVRNDLKFMVEYGAMKHSRV